MMLPGDFDGDGNADVLLGDGATTWIAMEFAAEPQGVWMEPGRPAFAADFNGDGADDLIVFDGQSPTLLLSNP